ncbi:MAG: hypothetical protein Q9218_007318 [Villophora microphyllina]
MAIFKPRDRKQRRKKNDKPRNEAISDTNIVEIMPGTASESEKKKREMRDSIRAQQPTMSSKKSKRLDKYIDKKIRKEDTLDLIKQLEANSAGKSALPSGKKDFRGQDQRKRKPVSSHDDIPDSNDSDLTNTSAASDDEATRVLRQPQIPVVGSGLKRKLEFGPDGKPSIPKRQRLKRPKPPVGEEHELPWEGFSSDADSDSYSESQLSDFQSVGTQTDSDLDESSSEISSLSEGAEGAVKPEDEMLKAKRKERSSAFKAWASQQVNEALGFTPSAVAVPSQTSLPDAQKFNIKPREPEQDPLPPELQGSTGATDRKAFSVPVNRPADLQEARLKLPIVTEEQKIMEAIYNHPTVIIWGATGSGKTTQLPQFLYEAGFGDSGGPNPGMIGITQPRRVAAVSMAKRVSDELGGLSSKVSHQIRFESSVSEKTTIKFMTDGILIREIANDFALLRYSVIVIDEAHERSTNTDILIGMVSRIVDLRSTMSREDSKIKPLKFIIMSATLRISDFLENSRLFRNERPPLLQAEGRQYPVTTHFARRTQRDYLEEAFRKVSKGHKRLPSGGMLVFLTGQAEITSLAKQLKATFINSLESRTTGTKAQIRATEAPLETEDLEVGDDDGNGDSIGDEDESDDEDPEAEDREFEIEDSAPASSSIHVLPLYSQLQTKDQLRVFEPPPEGSRLIVLATNVAETSLTIPGIRYVFDCGRAKEKKYDQTSGVQSFEIGWISKASASQRAGRAGRIGPGHCYRLYSSAVYERDFEDYTEPEILRTPVEDVVMQLKSMDLQHVVNFPFPTPPDGSSLAKAEKLLTYLGALSSSGKITPIGRDLSIYPLSPRFSKMLLLGHQQDCMAYTIAMVAALAVPDLFILENQLDLSISTAETQAIYTHADQQADLARERQRKDYNLTHQLFSKNSPTSDALKALTALCAYAYASEPFAFCNEMFLRPKAMNEATRLRAQLSSIVRNNRPTLLGVYQPRLPEPSKLQLKALEQIVAAAFIDQIAIRADLSLCPPEMPKQPSRAIDVPYLPLFPTHQGRVEDLVDVAVYIHPSSVLSHIHAKELPQYIVYARLQRGTAATIEANQRVKTRMHALTAVTGNQIAALAKGTPLLEYGKPIGKVVEVEGGGRECWVGVELRGEKGREGWPLGAKRVIQRRGGGEWIVEKVVD